MLSVYIHIPFCKSKCPYCDFYSASPREESTLEQYEKAVCARLFSYGEKYGHPAVGTVYFGGGTPSVFGAERLCRAVGAARAAGIRNLSLDLMLALPHSTCDTLARSVDFCASLGADHVSAYILKIEPGTAFAARAASLGLPDEDGAADQYLFAVERLQALGYRQYEISNFARPGFESRHNLQYWRCGEYLGLGPAAHSFVGGRRFYFPRDLAGFLAGGAPVDDGPGGAFPEYAMLALRLTEGLRREDCVRRFADGGEQYEAVRRAAARLPKNLIAAGDARVALTAEGFLVSNAVLAEILP